MIDLTSNYTNIYEFTDYNTNSCRSMVIDAMKMSQNYSGKGSYNILLVEEPIEYTIRYFKLLKYSSKLT